MARENKRQQMLDKNKMVKAKACAFCKKEVKGLAVLSPTLNESERCMCPSCFKKKYPVNKKELAKMIGDDE